EEAMTTAARAVPVRLEYTLGELKDRSAARRQRVLLAAAPQIHALQKKLSKASRRGLENGEASTAREALKVYNPAIADGRYVKLMKRDPEAAAAKLGRRITPEVSEAIAGVVSRVGGEVEGPIEAVIAVAVVVVTVADTDTGIVIDEQARVKVERL